MEVLKRTDILSEHQQKLKHQYNTELRRIMRELATAIAPRQGEAPADEEGAMRHADGQWRQYCAVVDKQRPTIPTDHDAVKKAFAEFQRQRDEQREAARPLHELRLADYGFELLRDTSPPHWLAHNMAAVLHTNGDVALHLRPVGDAQWPIGLQHTHPTVLVPGMTLRQLTDIVKVLGLEHPRRPDSITFQRAHTRKRRTWFTR